MAAASYVARTGGNLPARFFLPEVWSMKLQAKFYANTVMGSICNTDWEGEIKDKGAAVFIRVRPTVVIDDYTVNSDIVYQDLDDERLELDIDKAKYFAFKVDDVDRAQADIKILNETTKDSSEQMKITVDSDVLANVHADATTDLGDTQLTKVNVLEWIVDANTELTELNVPEDGRWGVLAPWVCGLIKKSDLKDASLAGDSTSIMRNGRIGEIDGTMLHKSNLLQYAYEATSALPTHNMFGTKHAITFASQFVKMETLRLQNTFGNAVRGLKVYGYKVVKEDALVDGPAYK